MRFISITFESSVTTGRRGESSWLVSVTVISALTGGFSIGSTILAIAGGEFDRGFCICALSSSDPDQQSMYIFQEIHGFKRRIEGTHSSVGRTILRTGQVYTLTF